MDLRLSENERIFLQTLNDGAYSTVAQVTQACGFQRAMGYHYYRSLSTGGLIDGFELTYLGHKLLLDEEIIPGDASDEFNIRLSDSPKENG